MQVFTCRSQGSIFAETQQKREVVGVLCWMRRNFIWKQQQQEPHLSLFQHHSCIIQTKRSIESIGERSFKEKAIQRQKSSIYLTGILCIMLMT